MSQFAHPIDEIFDEAVRRTPGQERDSYLDQACGDAPDLRQRVERLLKAMNDAGRFMETSAQDPAATQNAPASVPLGSRIGPYKLLQLLGEGGMGEVYMAEQTQPVERRVAVKIIKAGMDSRQVIARFEAERQALAMMDHPNIAQIFDAGTTETGRPYFVMELVKGTPITQYCDENRLDTRQRLMLFQNVCQAVQHAHHKGIIHRDLKPSNVLVAEYDDLPVPKVIDFGVAKATQQRLTDKTMFTEIGMIVGTIEYMSPEQAKLNQLDIDTRSDVYSLGVLLYELLTGETPFDRKEIRGAALDEMLRIIREEEPSRPSIKLSASKSLASVADKRDVEPKKLGSLLRGELDWVVMKALEKDRSRRYETVSSFGNDVQRYLDDEPVEACPPTLAYRIRKFSRRNKRAMIAASLLGLALVGLMLGALQVRSQLARAARDAEIRAEQLARDAEAAKLVERLLNAETSLVPSLTEQLSEYREFARNDLRIAFTESSVASDAKLHAALAMLPADQSVLPYLTERLLRVAPTQFELVRDSLENFKDELNADLWKVAQDSSEAPTRRLRAAAALASYDTDGQPWQSDASFNAFVGSQLANVPQSELAIWRNILRPVILPEPRHAHTLTQKGVTVQIEKVTVERLYNEAAWLEQQGVGRNPDLWDPFLRRILPAKLIRFFISVNNGSGDPGSVDVEFSLNAKNSTLKSYREANWQKRMAPLAVDPLAKGIEVWYFIDGEIEIEDLLPTDVDVLVTTETGENLTFKFEQVGL